jgi:hypothetical protein
MTNLDLDQHIGGRQETLQNYGVYHWIWSYVHLITQETGGSTSPLSDQETSILEAAFRTQNGPINDALLLTQQHILMTNARNDFARHTQGIDAMYTGFSGRFFIPYTDVSDSLSWPERLRVLLLEQTDLYVLVSSENGTGSIHTLGNGQTRVDAVMRTTFQKDDRGTASKLYSIRIVFDATGMNVEFRRDTNHIYLVLRLISNVVDWELSTNDAVYQTQMQLINDPVVVMATCMLLRKNIRYPQCTPQELGMAVCVSLSFTRPAGLDRHSIAAMIAFAAGCSVRGHAPICVARPAYNQGYGPRLSRTNSETYDIDRFDRQTSRDAIRSILCLDRRDNHGERLVVYTSMYNHHHIRTIIEREYLPAFDVLIRHFVYSGLCKPRFGRVHYHTMGIETWAFQGSMEHEDWVINMSVNTSRVHVHDFVGSLRSMGWSDSFM